MSENARMEYENRLCRGHRWVLPHTALDIYEERQAAQLAVAMNNRHKKKRKQSL
jgi:hypothetical protein